MVQENSILWIDLETTGSSNEAQIIEFGGLITDATPELAPRGELSLVIFPELPHSVDTIAELYEAPAVENMHTVSGLTKDVEANGIPLLDAEKQIIRWINDTIGPGSEHIPWGGSGVGHFDSKFIRRDWEYLSKRLTYWVYDVGVIRRSLRLIGVELPKDTTEVKTHRALEDIQLHVEEMRQYLYHIKEWRDIVMKADPVYD